MARSRALSMLIPLLVAVIGLPLVAAVAWVLTDTAFRKTAGKAFCVTCHSMALFAATHERDLHGGNNPAGVKALCVDCHLPHDNGLHYLVAKGRTGLRDVWVELVHSRESVNWVALREERESFVYDSGCLRCHQELAQATASTPAAFLAHRAYFLGDTTRTCVSCHPRVGHRGLDEALTSNGGGSVGFTQVGRD
jgi:cytochrome c-type protein NapC